MSIDRKILLTSTVLILALSLAGAQNVQHHPFSELFPPDTDLDFGQNSAFNLSEVNLNNGIILDQNAIRDSGDNYDILRLENSGKIVIPSGNLDISGNRIKNVPAPVNASDAVNKSYVDQSDTTIADDQNLEDVLSRGNDAGSYNINLTGNKILDSNNILADENTNLNLKVTGQDKYAGFYDEVNTQLILKANEGGNVQIPNGNLRLNENNIKQADQINFTNGGRITSTSGNNANIRLRDEDNQVALVVDRGAGVDIPNGVLTVGEIQQNTGNIYGNNIIGGRKSDSQIIDFRSSGNIRLTTSDGTTTNDAIRAKVDGDVSIPNGDLNVSGNYVGSGWGSLDIVRSDVNADDVGTSGGINSSGGDIQLDADDLDSSGNIDDFSAANDLDSSGNVVSDSVGSGEIAENAVGNSELDNSVNIDLSTLDVSGGSVGDGTGSGLSVDSSGNLYFDGSLNFPGDVNTVSAQQLNGSIIPDRDADQNIGSSSKRWNDGYFAGDIDIQGGRVIDSTGPLTIGDGNVEVPNGALEVSSTVKSTDGLVALSGGTIALRSRSSNVPIQLRDSSNNVILEAEESSNNVNIPNGNLISTTSSGNALQLKTDSGNNGFQDKYIGFYQDADNPNTLSGLIGYPISDSKFEIRNSNGNNIELTKADVQIPDGSLNVSGGDVLAQDGSAADPAVAFDNDQDTGIAREQNDGVSITGGGSEVARFTGGGFLDLRGNTITGVGGQSSASTGALRLANDKAIAWRNNANDGNIDAVFVDSNDRLNLGRQASSVQFRPDISLRGNVIQEVGGTTDASSGAIRLANGANIRARNSGNSADLGVLGTDNSDNIYYGWRGNYNNIYLGDSTASGDIVAENNLNVSGNRLEEVGGTTDATSGAIRLANNNDIVARNSNNDGDLTLLSTSSGSNVVQVGGPADPPSFVETYADFSLNGNSIREVGGTTDASNGAIRLANGNSIQARDSGNNNDIEVIGTDSNDNVQIGGNGNINKAEIPNSNLDMGGNNVTNVDCIGDQC